MDGIGLFRLFGIFLLLIFVSCEGNIAEPKLSFYHWQSYFDVSVEEYDYLEKLSVERLYVRYFDVDFQGGKVEAIGKILNQNNEYCPKEIIPTIFITNRTFKYLEEKDIRDLSDKIISLIKNKHSDFSNNDFNEIQFDCDWTESTRDKYFSFLKLFKERNKINLSATIRLHQIKFKEKTGIPPVDRFILMCYNTGEVSERNEINSILNPKIVEQYISDISSYPDHLELALPLFSWAVLFRNGKLIKLIRNVDLSTFDKNENYEIIDNKIKVINSTYLNGYYLYGGDELRLESMDEEILKKTIHVLKENNFRPKEIIYYHLDSVIINQFPYEILENINNEFTYH